MTGLPELPLEAEAAIERCEILTKQHAEVTWKWLFPPHIYSSGGTMLPPPRASLLLELREYASAMFDCKAQQFKIIAPNETILREWLNQIAAAVQRNVIRETDGRFEYVRATIKQRKQIVAEVLKRRIEHWVGSFRSDRPAEYKQTDQQDRRESFLGNQLKALCEEARLTVEQLAEAIGVEPRSVYRHFTGTPPRKRQIAEYEKVLSRKLHRLVRLETSAKRQ
jgi:hypothetical protein